MKRKIRLTDEKGKVIEGEIIARDLAHLDSQLTYRAQVYRDRTKYRRKRKHKNREEF